MSEHTLHKVAYPLAAVLALVAVVVSDVVVAVMPFTLLVRAVKVRVRTLNRTCVCIVGKGWQRKS